MRAPYIILDANRGSALASVDPLPKDVVWAQVIALGEEHERKQIIETFRTIILYRCEIGLLKWLALEHFNTHQQGLLDAWVQSKTTWEELKREYERGPEGFNLEAYKPLLEAARDCGSQIIGVMPPRDKANKIARSGGVVGGEPCLPIEPSLYPGYEELERLFPRSGPMARIPLGNLLLAQSYKDSTAACTVYSAMEKHGVEGILMMGWAHIEVRGSVPDRIELLAGKKGLVRRIGFRTSPIHAERSAIPPLRDLRVHVLSH